MLLVFHLVVSGFGIWSYSQIEYAQTVLKVVVHLPVLLLLFIYMFEKQLGSLYDVSLALATAAKGSCLVLLRVPGMSSPDQRMVIPMHALVVLLTLFTLTLSVGRNFLLNAFLQSLAFLGTIILFVFNLNDHLEAPPSMKLQLSLFALLAMLPILWLHYEGYRQ